MKQSLFRLAAILMALCLLAGCGAQAGSSQQASASASAVSEAAPEAEAPETEESALTTDISPAEGEPEGAETAEEEPEVNTTLEYFPLEEPEEISIMVMTNPLISSYASDPSEFRMYQELESRLNIELDITSISPDQILNVVPLMISSLDMPNVVFSAGFLGNYDTALDNGLISDLTDVVEEYMPNYNRVRTATEELRKDTTTDSGRWPPCTASMRTEIS